MICLNIYIYTYIHDASNVTFMLLVVWGGGIYTLNPENGDH